MKKLLLSISTFATAVTLNAQTVDKHKVDGEIYIKVKPSLLSEVKLDNPNNLQITKVSSLRNTLFKYGANKLVKPFYQADDDAVLPYILKAKFTQINQVHELIEELQKIKGVDYAEQVNLVTVDATPNDPTIGAHLTQIGAQLAWDTWSVTSNITCAVVDNAVAWTHPDLVQNTFTNTAEIAGNGVDDDLNGYIDDRNGWDAADNDNNPIPTNNAMDHGTHCAGIAGARTNNGIGVASIGWNIKIIPVKCQTNGGSTIGIANGYGGILYAAKMKARVISCSWGGAGTASAAEQSVIDYAWNKGCIVMAAAGNSNVNTLTYPGAYNRVYCVASCNGANAKSGFSNYGAWVDITAPGENISSTVPGNTYQSQSGTSMATPLVAGLAALMLSRSPQMTQTDVLNCISSTALNIAAANSASLAGQLGAGRIRANLAMSCAAGFSATPVVSNFYSLIRNTCPNTPIVFTDSSLYLPTAWSWTFQAGMPATSTSSAPSVQWTTPGTYSVAMQATNINGGNTATKVSYITVAGPIALPFSQGFQAAQFLPPNWSSLNIGNDNYYWERATGFGGFITSTACAVFDNYNDDVTNERDEMRSPKLIFTNVPTARLRFDVAYRQYDNQYSDSLEVKISTNCGATWNQIYLKGGQTLATNATTLQNAQFTPTTAALWRRDTIDITPWAAGQQNVLVSFVNRGHYGQAVYLDNINIVNTAINANFNAISSACANAIVNFTNSSTNSSTIAPSYSWSFSGGTPATSTASNPSVTFATPGTKTVTLIMNAGGASSTITQTMTVAGALALTVNNSTLCSGNSASLIASGASSYTWNTGATTNSISVSPNATTSYTVTGSNGVCSGSITSNVNVTTTPTVAINNQTICSGGTATLQATGAATYSWNTGSTSNPILVAPASNTTYVVTGNNGPCSNTKTVTVTIGTGISINILPINPQLCAGSSLTLNAGGATTYTWNTGSNASSIIISPSATTNYTVSGNNGACSGTAIFSVGVNPLPIAAITSSNISCNGLTNGSANANISSGTAPFTYSWSGGQTTQNIGGLGVGAVTYTVTDSKGCKANASTNITQPTALTVANSNTTQALCNQANGTASVTINGGTSPYNYSWNTLPAQLTANANSLTPGSWVLTTTDNKGCVITTTVTISGATTASNVAIKNNITCNGLANGSATVTSTPPSIGPFTYQWSTGATTSVISSLTGGVKSVTVTDVNGCKTFTNVNIINPSAIVLGASSTNASCGTCADGSAIVLASGGTGAYTYTWSPAGGNTDTPSGLVPACYTVSVADVNNCIATTTTCVSFASNIGVNVLNNILNIYPNPTNGILTIKLVGLTYNYFVYNAVGQIILNKQNNENISELNLSTFARGVYVVKLESNGQHIFKKIVLE